MEVTYYTRELVARVKSFIVNALEWLQRVAKQTSGVKVIKLFTALTYKCLK
jgi:hypothetical protein